MYDRREKLILSDKYIVLYVFEDVYYGLHILSTIIVFLLLHRMDHRGDEVVLPRST